MYPELLTAHSMEKGKTHKITKRTFMYKTNLRTQNLQISDSNLMMYLPKYLAKQHVVPSLIQHSLHVII